jgi:hypothetical protein
MSLASSTSWRAVSSGRHAAHVLEEELERVGAGVGLEVELARRAVGLLGQLRLALVGLRLLEQLDAELVEVPVELLGLAGVDRHALHGLRHVLDAQEPLLLAAGQEALDLFQVDHLRNRHHFTSGSGPSDATKTSSRRTPSPITNIGSILYRFIL